MFIIGTDFILIYFINRVLVPDSFVGLIFVNMKTLKMKVKPYTKEQNHLELILRPKERDNWLQALINDDSQSVKSILSKCGSGEKKNYLNGCFEVSEDEKASDKSRCRIGLKNRDTKESFSHSLHMAAAFGSHQTVTSLIKHECNVFVTNTSGRNVIHCIIYSNGSRIFPRGGANSQNCYYFSHFCRKLHENERIWTPRGGARPWRPPLDPPMIYVSFMRADFEDEMIEMFRTIRQNVSLSVLRELLMQEDDCGCRPTEYAMHLGVLGIAREIFSTKGIFLTNIEYDGCGETGWFDITDYEESRKRMTRSPIVLFALLDRSRLENQHFKELFFSQAFQQWVHTKTKAARPFLFLWFVLGILFAILYYAADSALLFSEENYLMKSRQINASSCLQFSDKKATEVSSFSCITACIIYSIVMMVFEISENYLFFFHKSQLWLFQTPMGLKRMVVQVAFYKVSQLICYISVACSLTARLFRLKRGLDINVTVDHVSYFIIGFCLNWSILQFVQALPAVGHFTMSLQRMLDSLLALVILFVSFAFTFVLIFSILVNQNKIACVPEFSTFMESLYSTWRALINILQFRSLSASDEVTLYLTHVMYVGIGSILMINFLIATFSATISWVDSHRKVILTIQRLSITMILESRITRIMDKIYRKYQSHYFIVRNNRIYLTQTRPILARQTADAPTSM